MTRNAAKAGDKEVARALNELWAEYDDATLECFLCAAITGKRPSTMVLPDRDEHEKVLAVSGALGLKTKAAQRIRRL
jgi:hypothetical protein